MTADKPRVCHVLRKYEPTEWGGAESHVAAVTDLQTRSGWLVDLFAPRVANDERGPLAPDVELRRYGAFLPFVGSARQRAEAIRHGGNTASLDLPVRIARRRPDIVHLHTGRRIGGAASLGARLAGVPFVISLHGPVASDRAWMAAETASRYRGLVDLGQPIGWLVGARSVLQRAARVICFNADEHRALLDVLPAHRVVRMSQGVDLPRFAAGDADRFLAERPHLRGKPLVVCVGRLSRQKNQALAVAAFARGAPSDAVLVLAGCETDAGYRDELVALAGSLGCADRLELLGNVAPERVPDILAAALVAIVPSSQEAFGLTAVEAWAAGRPALCALTAGMRPLAAALDEPRLFLADDNPERWAAALRALCASPERMRRAGAAGQRLVAAQLSWSARVAELLALYADVIEEVRS